MIDTNQLQREIAAHGIDVEAKLEMADKFQELVRLMRLAQKTFFKSRAKGLIPLCKHLEQKVDAELKG